MPHPIGQNGQLVKMSLGPKSQVPDPQSEVPDPESQNLNPKFWIQGPRFQIPNNEKFGYDCNSGSLKMLVEKWNWSDYYVRNKSQYDPLANFPFSIRSQIPIPK